MPVQGTLQAASFRFVARCSLVEIHRRFRGAFCFHHQGPDFCQTALCSDPQTKHNQTRRCDILKCHRSSDLDHQIRSVCDVFLFGASTCEVWSQLFSSSWNWIFIISADYFRAIVYNVSSVSANYPTITITLSLLTWHTTYQSNKTKL
jgi:hypothetical protein